MSEKANGYEWVSSCWDILRKLRFFSEESEGVFWVFFNKPQANHFNQHIKSIVISLKLFPGIILTWNLTSFPNHFEDVVHNRMSLPLKLQFPWKYLEWYNLERYYCIMVWPCNYNLRVKVKVLVAQLCPTLCNSMDCSPPGSSVHGISQARILEWVAISFSRESSWPRHQIQVFHIAGRFFTVWATKEAHNLRIDKVNTEERWRLSFECRLHWE